MRDVSIYCEHFGLIRPPFELTPDPAFLYLSEVHREGLATMVYGVQSGKGFVMLTGEVGTGKTTLLHALLAQLQPSTHAAFIFNPRLEPLDFFRILLAELDLVPTGNTKAEYLLQLNEFLIERLSKNEQTLLIIDEAQNLSAEMLEEVRLLSNLETSSSKLIQILLVGQPELKEMLKRPDLRQLKQRIAISQHLAPLNELETKDYVENRLRTAGFTGRRLFRRGALKTLYQMSAGTPRLINSICDSALLLGFVRQKTIIDADMIQEVAADLDLIGDGGQLEREAPEHPAGKIQKRGIFSLFR